MSLLEINNVTKRFGGVCALHGVSLDIAEGQIVSIIGPNGAGKTTLFNVLTGVYAPEDGRVRVAGRETTRLPPNQIARRGIGRTFQNIRLFGAMTVFENVLVGEHPHVRYSYWDALLRTPRFFRQERAAWDRARQHLAFVGLQDRAEELARSLPYGEQRRLELARALALRPRLLLLDEPGAGLNPREIQDLQRLIRRIRDERQVTIALIEHHMKLVMDISDRIAVLDYGTKLCEGTPDEVRNNPQVIEAYLGRGALDRAEPKRP
jgi:branched-chain amino acid transport system ATP-binding protein